MKAANMWTFVALLALACSQKESAKEDTQAKAPSPKVIAPPPEIPDKGLRLEELRQLSRHPGPKEQARLKRLLFAGKNERLWATLGLGLSCGDENRKKTHGALTSAVAAWATERKAPSTDLVRSAAWAIGSCAASEAEDFLRAWLTVDPATKAENLIDAGAFGLAALVDRSGSITERTQTAILDAAAREKRGEILLPLGRMGRLSDSVGAHVLEVAGALIVSERIPGRRQAILALGSAGPSAAEPLSQVLLGSAFETNERAAAAQALGRLGDAGQKALDSTLATMLDRGLPKTFDRETWIPLRATLHALDEAKTSQSQLGKLRSLVLSEGEEKAKKAQRRRLVWLRCRAADLLAGDRYRSQALLDCSPTPSRVSKLALLRVIARGRFTATRAKAFQDLLESDDPVVAQAALRLIPSHPELKKGDRLLLNALASEHAGTQATAAQIIAAYPSRALKDASDVGQNEELLSVLGKLIEDPTGKLPLETRAAAIKAAGALQALSLKPAVERVCDSALEALWGPSARALSLLGRSETKCPAQPGEKEAKSAGQAPAQKAPAASSTPEVVSLVIDSDVGELGLQLDDASSPESRARFLSLVDQGFYDGISIHGESPGFAIQFGDKNGDGYDETISEPLPHEVTWRPFDALSVGMSAFSEGSQNSQIFVVLSDAPQLTGSRVRLGKAEGPWHLLTVGDVLHSVKRSTKTQK